MYADLLGSPGKRVGQRFGRHRSRDASESKEATEKATRSVGGFFTQANLFASISFLHDLGSTCIISLDALENILRRLCSGSVPYGIETDVVPKTEETR